MSRYRGTMGALPLTGCVCGIHGKMLDDPGTAFGWIIVRATDGWKCGVKKWPAFLGYPLCAATLSHSVVWNREMAWSDALPVGIEV